MTKDEVTRIALECGFQLKELPDGTMGLRPYVYAFAKRLIEDEREACAKECDMVCQGHNWETHAFAKAIRASSGNA